MKNEYMSYLETDTKLYALVKEKLPELQELNALQIEKLVFFLKSLHHYYPNSENHIAYHSEFSDKLEKIKNGTEQLTLQKQAGKASLKGMLCCILSGVLLVGAIAFLLSDQKGFGICLLVLASSFVLFADSKLFKKAMEISKEQDRKYFLSSIRAAKACNELDWAGLFAYTSAAKTGSHSGSDLSSIEEEIGSLTNNLRAALYNDEYFQYSPSKLKN